MKSNAEVFLSCLLKIVSVLSILLVSLLVLSCDMWNKDWKSYLEYWSETVQVGRVEVANAALQKNDSGVDTISVDAAPTITGYIINPQGFGLVMDKGDSSASDKSVRISEQNVLNLATVSGDHSMLEVKLATADESLEHTTFTVNFVPVRSDTMQSAPDGMSVTLGYNTPSLPPARINRTVAEDGSVSYVVVKEGELWTAADDGKLYWAWDDSVTDEKSPKFAKWFEVGGVRRLLADCKVSPEEKVGTRSLFCWNTGNVSITLAAVDGEGVSSPKITSGTVVPAGSDVTPPSGVTGVVASYSADGTITVTWTDPADTDGDLQEVVVGLGGGTVTKSPIVVAKGVQFAQFTDIPGDGAQYTVTVVARDASGNDSEPATAQVLADATAPNPVTDLAATYELSGNGTITVTWKDPVDTDGDLASIEVSLGSDASVPVVKNVQLKEEVVSFTDVAEDRTEYTVTVVAVDASGNKSAAVSAQVLADATAPNPVTDLAAIYSADETITVTWTAPAADDLKSIEVSLEGKGNMVSQAVEGTNQTATFIDITEDRAEYTITAVAVDTSGNRSAEASVRILADATAPNPVTDLAATYELSGNGTITVTWIDPADTDGDLQEIKVTLTGGTNGSVTKSVPPDAQGNGMVSFTDIPEDRTRYTVTVVAVDASGNESAAATKTVVADKTGPGVVTNIQVSQGETTVTLTWTNPSPAENDFKETVVTCSDTSVTVAKTSDTSATVTGFTSGKEYTFTFTSSDDLENESAVANNFTWQKLTLNSIIGSGFTKDGQTVSSVSGTTLVLYYLQGSTVEQTVYNAYKPVADGNTFSWWKNPSTGNQQTGVITMDKDVTLIANYSAVDAANAVNYIKGLGAGEHTVNITGNLSGGQVRSVGLALTDTNQKITLDLTGAQIQDNELPQLSFQNATALVEVKLPDSLTKFYGGFSGCSNLKTVNIPNGTKVIIGGFFYGCSSLTSITIPDSVTEIRGAFDSCSSLTSITIPDSVNLISKGAFDNCSNLQTVIVEATTPPTIDSSSTALPFFYECANLTAIYVPQSQVSAYKAASGWSDCASIIVGR